MLEIVENACDTVVKKWGEENSQACEVIKNEMRIIRIEAV